MYSITYVTLPICRNNSLKFFKLGKYKIHNPTINREKNNTINISEMVCYSDFESDKLTLKNIKNIITINKIINPVKKIKK